MDYFTDLSVADCEFMNSVSRALGPEGSDVITQGECEDLSDAWLVGSLTARRWFRVPSSVGGPLPAYRRLVPIAQKPGDFLNPYAPGRSIVSMYPTLGMSPIQRFAIDLLRMRCHLGAAVTEDGLTKDARFHGGNFTETNDFVFLSDAIELGVNAMTEGHWGHGATGETDDGHGRFLQISWYKIILRYIPPASRSYAAKWRVTVFLRRPHPIIDEGNSN